MTAKTLSGGGSKTIFKNSYTAVTQTIKKFVANIIPSKVVKTIPSNVVLPETQNVIIPTNSVSQTIQPTIDTYQPQPLPTISTNFGPTPTPEKKKFCILWWCF